MEDLPQGGVPPEPKARPERDPRSFQARSSHGSGPDLSHLGVQFAASLLVFTYLGYWLDKKLGTSPWLIIAFVFIGAGGAFYSVYRKVIARPDHDAKRDR